MRKAGLFCALGSLLLMAAPASALPVWYENFENTTVNMSWSVHNAASGWMTHNSRGDGYGGCNLEIHHVTNEVDNSNPANHVTGVGNALETPPESWSGADAKQVSLGNPNGTGGDAPPYGGIWKIVTGLPIGRPLTLDGAWRCRGGWGQISSSKPAWANVVVNDNTTQLPSGTGGDYGYGTVLWQITRTSTNVNGGDKMSVWHTDAACPAQGAFTTTDGTVLILLRIGASGTSDTSITFDFDDVYITPEPATVALFGLAGLALLRPRSRRA